VAVLGPDAAGTSIVIRMLATQLPEARLAYLGAHVPGGRARSRPAGPGTVERWLRLAARGAVVRRHRRRGRIVLLDHHPLEVTCRSENGTWRSRLGCRLVARLVAGPDVLVVLDAPTDVLHARNPELSLEAIERSRRRYRQLAATRGAVVVDGGRPWPEVVADVRDAIATAPPPGPRR
jgi:thymidylate kinase